MAVKQVQLTVAGIFKAHLSIIGILLHADSATKAIYLADGNRDLLRLVSLFDMAKERSFPNFISAAALLVTAAAAFLISRVSPSRRGALVNGWRLSAAILLFLAFDEGVSLHDRLAVPGQALMHSHGIFFIGWILPYLALLILCGLLLLPFAVALPRPVMFRLMAAAIVYVGASMGLEMIEGLLMERSIDGASLVQVDQEAVNNTLSMVLLVALEESGEMLGVALALRALLLHLGDLCPTWRLTLANIAPSAAIDEIGRGETIAPSSALSSERS